MVVITHIDEYTSSIPPYRLFKALILDADILIPKLMPQALKSIDTIQGDGRAGSIKQINFAEGSQIISVRNRVDEVDDDNCVYNYTLIEGDISIMEKLEFISYEVKFEATPEGSKNKMVSKYHTKGDIELNEEDIKAGKEKALGMYKVVEAYLLQNPDVYPSTSHSN